MKYNFSIFREMHQNAFRRNILLLLIITGLLHAQVSRAQFNQLTEKISLRVQQTSALKIIEEIDRQSNYTFLFAPELLNQIDVEKFEVKEEALGKVLNLLTKKYALAFSVVDGNISVKANTAPAKKQDAGIQQHKGGTINGKVIDEENGLPVVDATVQIGNKFTTTKTDGGFLLQMPAGKYEARITSVGYSTKVLEDVQVNDNEVNSLDISLARAKGDLAQVVVRSSVRKESVASLYIRQKNNASISDGISREQIQATPDNTAGQALKRVSGVVVQENKFVTIRGVSDRYNNVLINGAILPSTEPNRRNFSFDIVPTSLIDNIVINKTATPDMPAEFTGGLVQINTRDIPEKNFLEFSVGSGFNSVSAGKTIFDAKRYSGDYFTEKGSQRDWFQTIMKPELYIKAAWGTTEEDKAYRRSIGAQIPANWKYYNYTIAPVQNYQLAGGIVKNFKNGAAFGLIGSASYRNEQTTEAGEKGNLAISKFQSVRNYFKTTIGGLLNMSYKIRKHSFYFKNLYNRRFTSQFDIDTGNAYSMGKYVMRTVSNVLINEVMQNRLEGSHLFTKYNLRFDWSADRNTLDRDQPDTRFVLGTDPAPFWQYNLKESPIEWGALYASRLKETRNNLNLNLTIPFNVFGRAQQFKTGYFLSDREADYKGSAFRNYDRTEAWYIRMAGLPYYRIATPENYANGNIEYFPTYSVNGRSTGDGYNGKQKVSGAYLMGDFRLLKQLRLVGGWRFEELNISMGSKYINKFGIDTLEGGQVPIEKDWLPSFDLIYSLTPKINLRLAYGSTLSRPDFVERSSFVYYDFAENLLTWGLQRLRTTSVKNYDFRVEFYPKAGETITASVFYKKFTNPVERFFVFGSSSNAVVYNNLDQAEVKGIEFDLRKSLGFIVPGSKVLQRLFVSGNYSYIEGEIHTLGADGNKVVFKRPVQGLAPYSINAGITYDAKRMGVNITYNKFGRRIIYGGTEEWGIQYENPRDVIDAQLSFRFLKNKLDLRLNASDLLAQPFIIYSNATVESNGQSSGNLNTGKKGAGFDDGLDLINYKAKRGTNYSFSLSYNF